MPYRHELANSLGAIEILTEENREWILKRLKTYGRKEYDEEDPDGTEGLKFIDANNLELLHGFTKAVAIDGSLSTVEEPGVTVLKIASVWGDLAMEPKHFKGIVNPASLLHKYRTEFSVGLLPGRDVYPKGKAGGWDSKFREEFYYSMRHMNVHGSTRSFPLTAFLRRFFDGQMKSLGLRCPNCSSEKIDFTDEGFETFCGVCGVDIYITDYLTRSLFTAVSSATGPMLVAEQILLHSIINGVADGHIENHTLEDTLFIADGPLRMFLMPEIAKMSLEKLQATKPYPGVVSFVKSGHIEKIFDNPKADDLLLPGHVAIITEKMRGRKKGDIGKQGNSGLYGKSFAYRTKDGSKRFGFMLPPKIGSFAAENVQSPVMDEWFNYPHLRAVVDFIESNVTNENGPTTPSLEIIGAANHAASLPYEHSKKVLTDLIQDSHKKS